MPKKLHTYSYYPHAIALTYSIAISFNVRLFLEFTGDLIAIFGEYGEKRDNSLHVRLPDQDCIRYEIERETGEVVPVNDGTPLV